MSCYAVLAHLSVCYPPPRGRLPTCYSPVRHCTHRPKPTFSFDLHVLGTPPAFVLSQDQTLQFNWFKGDKSPYASKKKTLVRHKLPIPTIQFSKTRKKATSGFSFSQFFDYRDARFLCQEKNRLHSLYLLFLCRLSHFQSHRYPSLTYCVLPARCRPMRKGNSAETR